jgi:hypothetical protein
MRSLIAAVSTCQRVWIYSNLDCCFNLTFFMTPRVLASTALVERHLVAPWLSLGSDTPRRFRASLLVINFQTIPGERLVLSLLGAIAERS